MKLLGNYGSFSISMAWSYDTNDINSRDCPSNGSWTSSNEVNKFTYTAGYLQIYFYTQCFYSRNGIGRIGYLIKAKDGSGDKKLKIIMLRLVVFRLLNCPSENSSTILRRKFKCCS
jgi:hypothetical protein